MLFIVQLLANSGGATDARTVSSTARALNGRGGAAVRLKNDVFVRIRNTGF
jgi:hypothetical protein